MTVSAPGEIITFYAYKGGTGRSMALANVGFLLAQQQSQRGGRGVLLVDWDLEAPGLHRFFRNSFRRRFGTGETGEAAFDRHPGLIDLFWYLRKASESLPAGSLEIPDELEADLQRKVRLDDFIFETDIAGLHFLKAGRFDAEYPRLVNTFGWEDLYQRAPWLIQWFAGILAERYDYVLIDSRTGITDTSGICTTLLPEKLVLVFTPNIQSTDGAFKLVDRAIDHRRRSDDLRPLIVFPLPSRIDSSREKLEKHWRLDPKIGYQPRFEELFRQVYSLPKCDLDLYFSEIQIQHAPDYAYGEEIATMAEQAGRLSLARSYESFTEWLLTSGGPWEKPGAIAERSELRELERRAFAGVAQLSPDEQELARKVLSRLVRVAPSGQDGTDVAVRVRADNLASELRPVVQKLRDAGVLNIREGEAGEGRTVELADSRLVSSWTQLKTWLDEDREFLLWRQRLDDSVDQWQASGKAEDFLLRGIPLEEARARASARPEDFNADELDFLKASSRASESTLEAEVRRLTERKRRRWRMLAGGLAAGLVILLLPFLFLNQGTNYVSSVHFTDAKTGWAVSWSIEKNQILSTRDGGETWSRQHMESSPKSVYFVSSSRGWIGGDGGILATRDGGATWTRQADTGVNSLFFVDERTGWAVGGFGLILATTDGGDSWSPQTTTRTDINLNSVYFSDRWNGWSAGDGGVILATSDGGKTWTKQSTPSNHDLKSVYCLNPKLGWAVGIRVILATRDGGLRWTPQESQGHYLEAVHFATPSVGWSVGVFSIVATTDGGATWDDEFSQYSLSAVHFIDPNTGWIAGEDVILSTTDGGKTWTRIWDGKSIREYYGGWFTPALNVKDPPGNEVP